VYYQKGDYPRAIEQLERAVRLVVDDPVIIEHLGDAYLKDDRPGKALRSYRDALKASTEAKQQERIRSKIGELEGTI
jgi:tetratricopeptide (TPR) repeat protein